MNVKRITEFGLSLVLGLSSLLVLAVPKAHAAADTCTWTGAVNANMNNAGNWTGCDNANLPQAGDSLTFPNGAGVTNKAVNNDFTAGTSFATITVSGSNVGGEAGYVISGNAIQLSFGIYTSSFVRLELDITATGNLIFSNTTSGGQINLGSNSTTGAKTLALGSNTLTVFAFTDLYANVTGSGNITSTNSLSISGAASGYTGTLTLNGLAKSLSLNNATGGQVIVEDGANLSLSICDGQTFTQNLTLNGTSPAYPKLSASSKVCPTPIDSGMGGGGCGECPSYDVYYSSNGIPTTGNVTLAGSLTLGADVTVRSYAKVFNITSSISGAKSLSLVPGGSGDLVINSSSNTSNTPNGTIKPVRETITLTDDLSAKSVNVAGFFELIINGVRGAVTVESGAKLKGSGTVGALTIKTDGILAPGQSPGCLNSGNLVLNGIFEVELAGVTVCTQYDQTKVTGTVDVTNGTLSTILLDGYVPATTNKFVIIDNDGADAVVGTFAGLVEGATVTAGDVAYKISYVGGDGNDVVLTVITSPNTGFKMLSNNPTATMISTLLAAGAIIGISKRYNRLSTKRK